MADKLKPCPFCGSDRITVQGIRDGQQPICKDCGARSGPEFHGKDGPTSAWQRACAKWNSRAALSKAEGRGGES